MHMYLSALAISQIQFVHALNNGLQVRNVEKYINFLRNLYKYEQSSLKIDTLLANRVYTYQVSYFYTVVSELR